MPVKSKSAAKKILGGLKGAGKLIGKMAKTAVKSTPLGAAASLVSSLKDKKDDPKKRKRNVMYYLKRIPIEKAKARLTKIKMSAYKGL